MRLINAWQPAEFLGLLAPYAIVASVDLFHGHGPYSSPDTMRVVAQASSPARLCQLRRRSTQPPQRHSSG